MSPQRHPPRQVAPQAARCLDGARGVYYVPIECARGFAAGRADNQSGIASTPRQWTVRQAALFRYHVFADDPRHGRGVGATKPLNNSSGRPADWSGTAQAAVDAAAGTRLANAAARANGSAHYVRQAPRGRADAAAAPFSALSEGAGRALRLPPYGDFFRDPATRARVACAYADDVALYRRACGQAWLSGACGEGCGVLDAG